MKLILDENRFDDLQIELLDELANAVKDHLQEAKVPDDILNETMVDIVFSIATIIDGSRATSFEGHEIIPVLTFLIDEDDAPNSGTLLHCGGPSSLHDHVMSMFDES